MNKHLSKFVAILIFFAGLLITVSASTIDAYPVKNFGSDRRSAQISFSETDWQLTKIEGAKIAGDKTVIRFDEEKSRVSGNGGCNAFGGTLTKDSAKIKITQIISTKMACLQGSDIESKFFRNLAAVTKYRLTGGRLQLFAGRKQVLEFKVKE